MAEELYEGALAKGIGDRSMEGKGWIGFAEIANPGGLNKQYISGNARDHTVYQIIIVTFEKMYEADTKNVSIYLPMVAETFNSKRHILKSFRPTLHNGEQSTQSPRAESSEREVNLPKL